MSTDQIALTFLIISTALVVTLIKALLNMMNHDWQAQPFSAMTVIRIFRWPLLCFMALILFIAFGIK